MIEVPPQWLEIGYYSAYAGSVTLSVGVNAAILWIIFWHKSLHTTEHLLVLSISAADILFSVSTVMFFFFSNYNYFLHSYETHYCSFGDWIYFAALSMRGIALVGLGWERYVVNVKPDFDPVSRSKILKGILSTGWLCSIMLPLALSRYAHFSASRITCYILWPHELIYYTQGEFIITVIVIVLVYALPSLILSLLNVKTLHAQVKDRTNVHITGLLREFSGKKKDAKMVYLMAFLFIVSQFPYHVLYIYVYYLPNIHFYDCYIHLYMLSFLGLVSTCLFFPIVYIFFNSSFRIVHNWQIGFRIIFLEDLPPEAPLVHTESEL